MSELLAAFVMPNDLAVDRLLKAASDVLRRAGKKASGHSNCVLSTCAPLFSALVPRAYTKW